jgi:5-methylcytosine-specific restriction enzyme A
MKFKVGTRYSRHDIFKVLGMEDPDGGPWFTGLVRHGKDYFIFCGINVAGRTGHDYRNRFEGPDLIWRGPTGSNVCQPRIRALLKKEGAVHVFYREHDRDPFTYAGNASVIHVTPVVPVEIRWSFGDGSTSRPKRK